MKRNRPVIGALPGIVLDIYTRQARPMRIYILALCILGILAICAAFAIVVDAALL